MWLCMRSGESLIYSINLSMSLLDYWQKVQDQSARPRRSASRASVPLTKIYNEILVIAPDQRAELLSHETGVRALRCWRRLLAHRKLSILTSCNPSIAFSLKQDADEFIELVREAFEGQIAQPFSENSSLFPLVIHIPLDIISR